MVEGRVWKPGKGCSVVGNASLELTVSTLGPHLVALSGNAVTFLEARLYWRKWVSEDRL